MPDDISELELLKARIQRCAKGHEYLANSPEYPCPWCIIEQRCPDESVSAADAWKMAAQSANVLVQGFLALIPALVSSLEMIIVTKRAVKQHAGVELSTKEQLLRMQANLEQWHRQYTAIADRLQ